MSSRTIWVVTTTITCNIIIAVTINTNIICSIICIDVDITFYT